MDDSNRRKLVAQIITHQILEEFTSINEYVEYVTYSESQEDPKDSGAGDRSLGSFDFAKEKARFHKAEDRYHKIEEWISGDHLGISIENYKGLQQEKEDYDWAEKRFDAAQEEHDRRHQDAIESF